MFLNLFCSYGLDGLWSGATSISDGIFSWCYCCCILEVYLVLRMLYLVLGMISYGVLGISVGGGDLYIFISIFSQ